MQWADLPLNPTTRMLRQFAGMWIVFFSGMALWQQAAHGRTRVALGLAILALTIGPVGLALPRLIRPVFVTWLTLAFPIGWVVSRVVLMVLFWGVLTPVAVGLRLSGRDVLKLRRRGGVTTYWAPKERPVGVRSYFRQF
jgi:hypothetical protein